MKLNLALSKISVRIYWVEMIICFPLQLLSKGSPPHKQSETLHLFSGGSEEGKWGREIKLQPHCSVWDPSQADKGQIPEESKHLVAFSALSGNVILSTYLVNTAVNSHLFTTVKMQVQAALLQQSLHHLQTSKIGLTQSALEKLLWLNMYSLSARPKKKLHSNQHWSCTLLNAFLHLTLVFKNVWFFVFWVFFGCH